MLFSTKYPVFILKDTKNINIEWEPKAEYRNVTARGTGNYHLVLKGKNKFLIPLYIFFFLLALQPSLGVVFYSPLVGFSLLAYEVSGSHTTTRHIR